MTFFQEREIEYDLFVEIVEHLHEIDRMKSSQILSKLCQTLNYSLNVMFMDEPIRKSKS